MTKPDQGNGVTTKARIDLKIDSELKRWVQGYAARKGRTVTDLVIGYFVYLREQEERSQDIEPAEQI